jgi:hypothetical protein
MNTPAKACLKALADATQRWPTRNKKSDGIMGDQAHMDRCSKEGKCEGHVLGNAFDITHDPASGCNGQTIADLAIQDKRTAYVIWNSQIYSPHRAAEGWRAYTGPNPHIHHCHVSIKPEFRDDDTSWGWAEASLGTAASGVSVTKIVVTPIAAAAAIASYYFIKNWIR